MVLFSVFDELRNKQNFFETSDEDNLKRAQNQRHWILKDVARLNVFKYTFFSQLTALHTLTKVQCIVFSLFLSKVFPFIYQLR